MRVNRSGSKIFGAHLTKTEQKALDIEARKSVIKQHKELHLDLDATILYALYENEGFTEKELREFWNGFNKLHDELIEYYMIDSVDAMWVCREKLKQIGIDVEKWAEEDERKAKNEQGN